jgi:hypothetical protein
MIEHELTPSLRVKVVEAPLRELRLAEGLILKRKKGVHREKFGQTRPGDIFIDPFFSSCLLLDWPTSFAGQQERA